MKFTSFRILENSLANRNRPLNLSFNNFPILQIKIEIHNIKIISSINSSHKWHILVPMMCKLMPMSTEYSINCTLWKIIYKSKNLIILTWLLYSLVCTNIISFIPWAFVTKMSKYEDYLCSLLS